MRETLGLIIGLTLLFSSCNKKHEDFETLSGKSISKAEIDKYINNQMDSLNIKGMAFALINNGKIVYENYYGIKDVNTKEPIDSITTFEAASIGKSVFTFFVMKQVEKGLLDLDTPLYQYLPYPDIEQDERYKLITARMVLSHTSGFCNLRWIEPDLKLNIKFTPGTDFEYSGEGYDYLTKVVAHLNNCNLYNLDSLFQEEVATPLQLEHFHFQINDYLKSNLASGHNGDSIIFNPWVDKSIFSGSGSLHTDVHNYAKFLAAILENRELTSESYKEMFKENFKFKDENWYTENLGYTAWSLGFGMIQSDQGTNYAHIGNNLGYSTGFEINREKKFGYVYFTNSNQRNELHRKLEKLLLK
ncbi:serine hydrolase domain-containing protein [Saccharicrinis sp. FJH2]|uniref:serine hydrolase domain-containing protein n=1 Tax=Saccharicrinis sp. FJH65 TaxID=3344659 RepID=UPI0035F3D2CB